MLRKASLHIKVSYMLLLSSENKRVVKSLLMAKLIDDLAIIRESNVSVKINRDR